MQVILLQLFWNLVSFREIGCCCLSSRLLPIKFLLSPTQKIPVQKGYTVYFMMKIMIIHYFRLSCTGVQKATCSAVLFWDARRRKTYHALIPPRQGMWMLSNLPRTTWRHSSTSGAKFRVCSVCSKNISTRVIQLNSYHKLM